MIREFTKYTIIIIIIILDYFVGNI